MFDVASTNVYEINLDCSSIEVGPSSESGMHVLDEDKRECREYEACVIPLQNFLFSFIRRNLPFSDFEIGIFNHLLIAPSHLHAVNWAYVNIF